MAGEQLVLVVAQMECYLGPARGLRCRLDGVVTVAGAFPADTVIGGEAGAPRRQRHAVGDDERRIEPDPKLADQQRVLRLVAGQLLDELVRAGFGDRADLHDDLIARHSNAVVGDGDRARVGVEADADGELGVIVIL